jgi:hypothetical protein
VLKSGGSVWDWKVCRRSRRKIDELMQSRDNRGVVSRLCGPVAQLGARFHGMEEVIGSIPIRSTNPFSHLAFGERSKTAVCVLTCQFGALG